MGITSSTTKFDVVNKAEHYNVHPSGIETINLVRCLNFDMGCALKYVMRRHGKEYQRSLKSARYYLEDQYRTGTPIVLNLLVHRLLDDYASAEPVAQAQNFYRAFGSYLLEPIEARFMILLSTLGRIEESQV